MPSSPKANRGPTAGPSNRRALIVAAREVFAADGLAAPLSSVAKKAGVGQGSLYRHFPDRMDLAIAVFDENLLGLQAIVDRPDSTLDDLLDSVIEQALVSTALLELILSDHDDQRVIHLEGRMRELADTLVVRERAAGRIGDHVSSDDVVLAVSMIAAVMPMRAAAARRDVAARAWAMFHAAFAPR